MSTKKRDSVINRLNSDRVVCNRLLSDYVIEIQIDTIIFYYFIFIDFEANFYRLL